jgi:hypothetical protein
MIPKHESITLPKHKRIRDVLERQSVRERHLRHGHRHHQKKVLFLLPLIANNCTKCSVAERQSARERIGEEA